MWFRLHDGRVFDKDGQPSELNSAWDVARLRALNAVNWLKTTTTTRARRSPGD